MRIDFHTHIFPPEARERRAPFLHDPGFSALYASASSRMAGHEDLLGAMKRDGIDSAVAMSFPWTSGEAAGLHNDYLLKASREAAGSIIPFACVPRSCADIAAYTSDLARAGFRGIGELAFYHEGFNAPQEEFLASVISAAGECAMAVCLHLNEPIGHDYTGKYQTPFSSVYRIVSEHPGVPIILSHWGGGILFYELMPEVRTAFAHVYYDTAASPYLYRDDIYAAAAGIADHGKILFGTDFPLLSAARYVGAIEASPLEEGVKSGILGENARRLLFGK
jgi:uncharacterized protein